MPGKAWMEQQIWDYLKSENPVAHWYEAKPHRWGQKHEIAGFSKNGYGVVMICSCGAQRENYICRWYYGGVSGHRRRTIRKWKRDGYGNNS